MKKSLVLGILGLAVGVTASYGQGQITLDTYLSSSSVVASVSGVPIAGGYYVGLYYGPAGVNAVASVAADPSLIADPMSLYAGFTLASGPGAVANQWVGASGQFTDQLNGGPTTPFQIAASGSPASYTLMLVVYNNVLGYDASSGRGHSAAFQMTAGNPLNPGSGDVGRDGMDAFFGVPSTIAVVVPEPTTLALGGLGGLAMLLMRRKKA